MYPAENIRFTRVITHAEEFYITEFSFSIQNINISLPIKLYGKVKMVRSPGMITVSVININRYLMHSKLIPYLLLLLIQVIGDSFNVKL